MMLCFINNEKCAASSKILNLFIHAPLLMRDDVHSYFPGLCGFSETNMWDSRHTSGPLSLMFSNSQRVIIELRRSLYSAVSDRLFLVLFVPLPPGFLK